MNKEANSFPSRREFLENLISVGVLAIANNKGDVLSNVVQDFEEQQPLSALDQETLEALFEATGVQPRLENKHIQEIISNWSIVHNEATSNIELVDTAYLYLGSIAVGRSVVNENGQNVIEWEPRYQVQENVRLVEMSLAEDDDIGKEPVPFYVLPNDSITVENMDLTLNLATVMSADPDDPHHTLTRYEFTEEFEQRFAAFANKYMQDYRGHEITIRLVDDQDPTTLSYLRTTSLDSETFLRFAVGIDVYTPTLAFGGDPEQYRKVFFNAFGARGLTKGTKEMEYLMTSTIIKSILFMESNLYNWRGGPFGQIQDYNQKSVELGFGDTVATAVTIDNFS